MTPEVVASNPRVAEDRGRVSRRRGLMIYCMEEVDQPSGTVLSDVAVTLSPNLGKDFHSEYKADLLEGVTILHHRGGVYEVSSAGEALYMPANPLPQKTRPENLTLI